MYEKPRVKVDFHCRVKITRQWKSTYGEQTNNFSRLHLSEAFNILLMKLQRMKGTGDMGGCFNKSQLPTVLIYLLYLKPPLQQ